MACLLMADHLPPNLGSALLTCQRQSPDMLRWLRATSNVNDTDDVRMAKNRPCQLPAVSLQDQERKKEKANRGSESGPVGGLWPQPMGGQGWKTCPVDRPSGFSKRRKMTRKCWLQTSGCGIAFLCNHHRIALWDVGMNRPRGEEVCGLFSLMK